MKIPAWLNDRLAQRWMWTRLGLRLTKAGVGYMAIWVALLATGLYQQYNLVLLTASLAAGPIAASLFMSAGMLRKVALTRRVPQVLFAGQPLALDYTLRNGRATTAALAVEVQDELFPQDRTIPGAGRVRPRIHFERVAPRAARALRWQGPPVVRGRYQFAALDLVTRSPFGLVERRSIVNLPATLVVYPRIGRLSQRWLHMQRSSRETQRGRRHDRTAQQQEYHGLRDYRSGDSPRWIHWRTTARTGALMVKEFEQENNQQIALLLDPWLPRSKVSAEQRQALERAIEFVATVAVDVCRRGGRSILLGTASSKPSVRQAPASMRLLHEFLDTLAITRGSPDGDLAALLSALPPGTVRDAMLVVVSTRSLDLEAELARVPTFAEFAARGLAQRLHVLDASRGDLDPLVDFSDDQTSGLDAMRPPSSDDTRTSSETNGSTP